MEPGRAALVVGLVLVLLLLAVPGFLVGSALDASRPFLERIAVAPAVSIALLGLAVSAVVGPMPARGFTTLPEFDDRRYLATHVADVATDPRAAAAAAAAAARWKVRYVLSGACTFAGVARRPDRAALAASSALREVVRSGDAMIYEIVGT